MKDILIYTVHKAASTFLHKLTHQITRELGIKYYSTNNKHRDIINKISWKNVIEDNAKRGCFGPIRAIQDIKGRPFIPAKLESYSIILHLRDPRDVLTSKFFYKKYSYPKKQGRLNLTDKKSRQLENGGIDKFVLKNISDVKLKYQYLCSNLFGKKNVVFLKYEDMVSNYGKWLEQFLSVFKSAIPWSKRIFSSFNSQNVISEIHKQLYQKYKNDFNVESEDIYQHKRQINPGDHKRKLFPETIKELNHQFSDILDLLQYDK